MPVVADGSHSIVEGTPEKWPALLGYNRVFPDDDAEELVSVDEDSLVVVGEHGDGRSAAFTSDCVPTGAPRISPTGTTTTRSGPTLPARPLASNA